MSYSIEIKVNIETFLSVKPMAVLVPTSIMDRMGCVDVTDYGAIGNGATDDYASIKSAIEFALANGSRYSNFTFVYLPPGNYLISDGLEGRVATASGPNDARWRAGFVLWAIDPANTTIMLQANATGYNTSTYKPMVKWGSESDTLNTNGSGNRAFRHGAYHMKFNLNGNTGAAALDFHASNRGGLEGLHISNTVKSGAGIYCTRSNNGPALISNCTIEKCATAIYQEGYCYNLTIKDCVIRDQGTVGIDTGNGNLAIEGLESYNNVPAVRANNNQSFISLYDSELRLHTGQSRSSLYGVQSAGRLEVDNLGSNAYDNPVRNTVNGTVNVAESSLPVVNGLPTVDRFVSYANKSLFVSKPQPLKGKAAPDAWSDDENDWAVFGDYGGTGTLQQLQNTIDAGSGREFVALPCANYVIGADLYIRDITKLIGFQSAITNAPGTTPVIYFDGAGTQGFTVLEHLRIVGCKLVHRSGDTLHVKHSDLNEGYENTSAGSGDVFFTDAIVAPVDIKYGQKAYATQLNPEYESVLVNVEDSEFRAIGFKTETSSTVGQTNLRAVRSKVQISGGVTYSLGSGPNNTTPKTPSIILEDCDSALLSWNCFDSARGFHDVQVRETINGITRELASTSLNGSSPACVSYSGGTQEMNELFSAATGFNQGTVTANSAFNSVASASFAARYNPNGYSLTASNGQVTVTGSDLGGNYRCDLQAAWKAGSSTTELSLLAQAIEITYGATTESIPSGRDYSTTYRIGVSGFAEFDIPSGTTSFTLKPKFYGTTNPVNQSLTTDEIAYILSYVGS